MQSKFLIASKIILHVVFICLNFFFDAFYNFFTCRFDVKNSRNVIAFVCVVEFLVKELIECASSPSLRHV